MVSVNVLRKDVSNGKKKVIWVRAKALSTERYISKAKSAISNGLSYLYKGSVQRVSPLLSQQWLVQGTPSTVDKSVP